MSIFIGYTPTMSGLVEWFKAARDYLSAKDVPRSDRWVVLSIEAVFDIDPSLISKSDAKHLKKKLRRKWARIYRRGRM